MGQGNRAWATTGYATHLDSIPAACLPACPRPHAHTHAQGMLQGARRVCQRGYLRMHLHTSVHSGAQPRDIQADLLHGGTRPPPSTPPCHRGRCLQERQQERRASIKRRSSAGGQLLWRAFRGIYWDRPTQVNPIAGYLKLAGIRASSSCSNNTNTGRARPLEHQAPPSSSSAHLSAHRSTGSVACRRSSA